MSEAQRFRIRRPEVIHEVLDGELVVVNLKSGAYFSLDRVGADVWGCIDSGSSVGEVVDTIRSRYAGDPTVIEREVRRLLDELQREELIGVLDGADSVPGAATPLQMEAPEAFLAPQLQKFTDMQELLLLDPIHEVDSSGWPKRRE